MSTDSWNTYESRLSEYWKQYEEKTRTVVTRFFDHFPKGDMALIALKGHLLIEEAINDLLSRLVKVPAALEKARLSFYQKVCIAQSITDDVQGDPFFWRSVIRVNTIRNKYAHKVEPADINEEISHFLHEIFQASGRKREEVLSEIETRGMEALLKDGLICVFFGIRGVIDGLDAVKSYPTSKEAE